MLVLELGISFKNVFFLDNVEYLVMIFVRYQAQEGDFVVKLPYVNLIITFVDLLIANIHFSLVQMKLIRLL